MRDDTIVSEAHLFWAIHKAKNGFLKTFEKAEPSLANFVNQVSLQIAGKLALSGAPPWVARGAHHDIVEACVIAYLAFKKGSFEIWNGLEMGERFKVNGEDSLSSQAENFGVTLLGLTTGRRKETIKVLSSIRNEPYKKIIKLLMVLPTVVVSEISAEKAAIIKSALSFVGADSVVTSSQIKMP